MCFNKNPIPCKIEAEKPSHGTHRDGHFTVTVNQQQQQQQTSVTLLDLTTMVSSETRNFLPPKKECMATMEDGRIPELVVADSQFLGYAVEIDLDLSNSSSSSNTANNDGDSGKQNNDDDDDDETASKTATNKTTIVINPRTATKSTLSNAIRASATTFQCTLKATHPNAAHIPIFWHAVSSNSSSSSTSREDPHSLHIIDHGGSSGSFFMGYDEDYEPEGSVGPHVMEKVMMKIDPSKIDDDDNNNNNSSNNRKRRSRQRRKNSSGGSSGSSSNYYRLILVGIVRYFGGQLLGVTCGRLSQCYERIVELTIHRHFCTDHDDEDEDHQQQQVPKGCCCCHCKPLVVEIDPRSPSTKHNLYGLGAGDTELILDVVGKTEEEDSSPTLVVQKLLNELQFDGFKGAVGETLPRLQSLQGDGVNTTDQIPVYRYPGNYSGDEWTTFEWSPTSLAIKHSVEEALKPLVVQTMNHCVANYYRAGHKDFIAHHSDKDLDLNRDGVIVSVSLGDERILELRRRKAPQDIYRVKLPHGSMLVLGPKTNQSWTHSILPKEDDDDNNDKDDDKEGNGRCRLSLTMRDVKTFQDLSTGKLYGQGVVVVDKETGRTRERTLQDIRKRSMIENIAVLGVGLISASILSSQTTAFEKMITKLNRGGSTTTRTTSTSSSRNETLLSPMDVLIAGACAVTTASAVVWKFVLSKRLDSQQQERAARKFFSLKSSSGTKY